MKEKTKRNEKMYNLHLEGWSYTKLAKKFKITHAMVGKIIRRMKDRAVEN